jgi:hypothetical protein
LIRHFDKVGATMSSSAYYLVEKSFYDYADDIEAVNIHYAVTSIGDVPDWENYRCTRYMPIVSGQMRSKVLKLPLKIVESSGGSITARYLLHHYFEICQSGDRHYTSLFTEEIDTDLPRPLAAVAEEQKSPSRRELLFEGS